MGDPRKARRKYSKPSHPWQADRINKDNETVESYGLKNKKEVWRVNSLLKKFKDQTKILIRKTGTQAEKEEKQLRGKLARMALIDENTKLENILDLNTESLLERRLQTRVYRKGLAKSMKQARQFIVHGHISIGEKKVTVPSYLVLKDEDSMILFKNNSPLSDPEHAERKSGKEVKAEPEEKEEAEEPVKEAEVEKE